MLDMTILVTNIQGKSVIKINPLVTFIHQVMSLDIETLHSGIYLIDIARNRGHLNKGVIVQH